MVAFPFIRYAVFLSIHLRKEAFLAIFHQKWMQVFQYDETEIEQQKMDINRNISEGIKRQALRCYKVSDEAGPAAKKDVFIRDMMETVKHHELAHGILQHEILDLVDVGIAGGAKVFQETIVSGMQEFLSDFVDSFRSLKGPIRNLIDIAKKDEARAIRMYYMYLSDVWFYDTDDEYMYTYSDLIVMMMSKYIRPGGSINWERLDVDTRYKPERAANPETVLERRAIARPYKSTGYTA
jgi:hypothetical protein